jgi:hypothetical protein
MTNLMSFEIVPLKMKQDPVSGAQTHTVDPEGKVVEYAIDTNKVVSVRPFTEEKNVFEISFELGNSFRTVVVYFESFQELYLKINKTSKY